MRIAIEIDEHAFLHPKSREEVEREVLEAAIFYWLSRREIEPAGAQRVARSAQTNLVKMPARRKDKLSTINSTSR